MNNLKTNDLLKLYISHFLTSWNNRLYEFASYLFIIEIFPKSLLYISIYGFCTTLSAIIFSNKIGNWIDIEFRLKVIRITILLQKTSIIISTIIFWNLLKKESNCNNKNTVIIFYSIIILLGCILRLSFIGNNIAIEKDWILVLSPNDDDKLIHLNTIMKRIDLFCKIMAPLSMFIFSIYGSIISVISLGIWIYYISNY
jgi:solute carrier family 40 (iron-regulated transporter), member 1